MFPPHFRSVVDKHRPDLSCEPRAPCLTITDLTLCAPRRVSRPSLSKSLCFPLVVCFWLTLSCLVLYRTTPLCAREDTRPAWLHHQRHQFSPEQNDCRKILPLHVTLYRHNLVDHVSPAIQVGTDFEVSFHCPVNTIALSCL